jgi:hypothetical protein
MALHNSYGVKGQSTGIGTPSLTGHTLSFVWTNNVLAGALGYPYPSITWMPTPTEYRAQFDADYRLTAQSIYHNKATDGSDLGFNWVSSTAQVPRPHAPGNVRVVAGVP